MINKRIIFIFLLMIIAIGTLSAVCASDLEDNITSVGSETPISIDEDTPLESSKPGTFSELQSQINNAEKGSTIYLTKDYSYNNDFKNQNGITITKSITIDGKGHAIDGLEKSPLILINKAGNVVLKNIIFKNGFNENTGIVSSVNSNNIKFNNCKFIENEASSGTVYLEQNKHVSFMNCDFYDNYANYMGGAVFSTNNNHIQFIKCNFESNKATHTGGAIYLTDNLNFDFDSCVFFNNSAEDGGAIYSNNDLNSSFNYCSFNQNHANYTCGALYFSQSDDCYLDYCSFKGNDAQDTGGAILTNKSNAFLNSCTFDDNNAAEGCCLYVYKSNIYSQITTFKNSKSQSGGTIYSAQSSLNIINNTFYNNNAHLTGGDIYSKYSMIFLEGTSFSNSITTGFGGSLSFNDDYVQLKNCTFEKCISQNNGGGAIYCLNSILNSFSSQFTSCNSSFGGAICSLNTDLYIENNTFYKNKADYYGGAIYAIYGSMTVDSSEFLFSSAQQGGGMYIRSPHSINNITNNKFLYATAMLGPRIYVDEYYGKIPESGNVYEDVYFIVGDFVEYETNNSYSNYSNILTYVISNSDIYQNNATYYENLRDNFSSRNYLNPTTSENHTVLLKIYDKYNPNNSTIFLNYNDYTNQTIKYECFYGPDKLNDTSIGLIYYNLNGDILTLPSISTFIDKYAESENPTDIYKILYVSKDESKTTGWYGLPVFDDETKNIYISQEDDTESWCFEVSSDEFPFNNNSGYWSYIYVDKSLISKFGNIYQFKSKESEAPLINYTASITDLPSFYDSRDYDYITPAKNQDVGKNCWAFSGIATLEACLKKITGETYDFSEDNAKNLMAISSIYGLNIDSNAGGYDTMFIGYLASWLGPIHESDDEYNPLSSLSIDYPSLFHIQDISFLPARQNSSDNNEFKYAIINYGAISVILNWTANGVYEGLHSVCIIGWDDDYNGIDSLGNYAEGAWIFKNSWGDEWGENGFGYLSYKQKLSEEISPYMHAYTFVFNDEDICYQDNYQYDYAGLTDFLCTNTSYIYYKNRFISKEWEILSAFSTYFEKPTYFTYAITINGELDTICDTIHYSPAGYHAIPLDKYIPLAEGDEFEIIIKLLNENNNNIPVCQADELYKFSYPSNVSFISYDGADWIDLNELNQTYNFAYGGFKSNINQVACIKAFMILTNDIIDNYTLEIKPFTSVRPNEDFYIVMTIPDWENDNEKYENYIETIINNRKYYSKITDGISYLKVKFDEEGNYSLSAKIRSNQFSSNIAKLDFIVDVNYTDTSSFKTFMDLRTLIETAEKNSTINLDYDYYFEESIFLDEHIEIEKSLTIEGNGHIIDGMSQSGIFKINGDCDVTLKNIYFKNGIDSAIMSYGKLTIYNCNFTNNSGLLGGAIYSNDDEQFDEEFNNNSNSYNTYINIYNCRFENNTAEWGGAIITTANMTLINTTLTNNTAEWGGAIYSESTCTISNSNFNNNTAEQGGAIYSESTCILSNSNFNNNTAKFGGAIYTKALNTNNCKFKNNTAIWGGAIYSQRTCTISNSNFNNNTAEIGGAISAKENTKITNTTFTNNNAKKGGAISNFATCNMLNSTFNSNTAEQGGAIYSDNICILTNSNFNNNTAENDGGAIYSKSTLYSSNCDFKNNTANSKGGAIYSDDTCILYTSNFNSNTAEIGGSIASFEYLTISNSTFKNNTANSKGGSIYTEDITYIGNSIFNFNKANATGGAITTLAKCYLSNSSFNSNTAKWGGAIMSTKYIIISYCNFKNNTANKSGGAIYSFEKCFIENDLFDSNNASWGGAIFSEDTSFLNIVNSNFTYNTATYEGGSIESGNMLNITNSKFKSNQNKEILFFNWNDESQWELNLKNNKIIMENSAFNWYDSAIPYDSKLQLVLSNITTIKGSKIILCQLKDSNSNIFKANDVNITLTKQNKKITYKLTYDDAEEEYIFDTYSLDYGIYQISGSLYDYPVINGTLNIVKKTVIQTSGLTKTYGTSNKLTVTIKDDEGNRIANTNVKVKISGKTYTIKTNSKGQASLAINMAPNTYTTTITFEGNSQYSSANTQTKVIVKKATPKLTASAKTFKIKTKNKKYTITLKNNLGKAMKNTKVTIKVNGKTYTVKTNSKGQATFTLKITKKGTYKATIKYNGDKYYNSVTKTATITVKK